MGGSLEMALQQLTGFDNRDLREPPEMGRVQCEEMAHPMGQHHCHEASVVDLPAASVMSIDERAPVWVDIWRFREKLEESLNTARECACFHRGHTQPVCRSRSGGERLELDEVLSSDVYRLSLEQKYVKRIVY